MARFYPRRRGWLLAGIFTLGNFAAAAPDLCDQAQARLHKFILDNTQRRCSADAECGGFYIRANSCVPPVVLAKKDFTPYFEGQLMKMQKHVRRACAVKWSKAAVCAPIAFSARCKNKMCVDALATAKPAKNSGSAK